MTSHSPLQLVRWRQQVEEEERVMLGELAPVASRRAVESCTLTKIEKLGGHWRILKEEPRLDYEPQRLLDYSIGGASIRTQSSAKGALWSTRGVGGRWAVRVAYPWLLDRYEDARFLESFTKRKDGATRRAEALEAAIRAPEGIDAHMYARQRVRGQSFDPHETNEDKYTATFHQARRFADGFRSIRRLPGTSSAVVDDPAASRLEPQLLYAMCETDPDQIVAELLKDPEVIRLRDRARAGTLLSDEHDGKRWRSAKHLEKQTIALADDALAAACHWSLGGPCVAAGKVKEWLAEYPDRELLWRLVRDIYVDTLAVVDRRFAEPRKHDAHPDALEAADERQSRAEFRDLVNYMRLEEIEPQAASGATASDFAGDIRERLDADEEATRIVGCALAVAALLLPDFKSHFPWRKLEAVKRDSERPRSSAAAKAALELFDELTR